MSGYASLSYACFGLIVLGVGAFIVTNMIGIARRRLNLRLNFLVGAILFLVAGVIAVYGGGQQVVSVYRSNYWPTTTGVITSAEVQNYTTQSQNTTIKRHRPSTTTLYQAVVVYEYQVDGRSYVSDQVAFDHKSSLSIPDFAQQTVARYPVGQPVTVYYSPNDPAVAVLEPGLNAGVFFTLGFGLIFLTVAAGLGYLYRLLENGQLILRVGKPPYSSPVFTESI
jgi:hypothetical protein